MGGECTADPLGLFHGCWTGGILPDMETEMTHAMNLSKRALGVPASPTLAITARVKELKAAGEDIIGFGAGEPDFGTPEVICDAAVESLRSGQTRYAPTPGTPEAREAIADKLRTENGIECTASDIIINNGAKFTVYLALQAIVNPGDVVLLPTPAWVSYKPMIELAGGVVREIPAGPDSDFKMTADQLEAAIKAEIEEIAEQPPSEAEMDRVRAGVLAEQIYQRDSVMGQAMELGTLSVLGLDWRLAGQFDDNLEAVTPEQVQQAARKWLVAERSAVAHVIPEGEE